MKDLKSRKEQRSRTLSALSMRGVVCYSGVPKKTHSQESGLLAGRKAIINAVLPSGSVDKVHVCDGHPPWCLSSDRCVADSDDHGDTLKATLSCKLRQSTLGCGSSLGGTAFKCS